MTRVVAHCRAAVLLAICCARALALNPALDVSQYAHTSWKIRDGFPKAPITSFAQTPDGYLWLGTEAGLFRFDGVKAVSWQPPAGQHLASDGILPLLVARDGSLWIGTVNGLGSWKDGKLTQYPELAGYFVFALMEDRNGTMWAGAGSLTSGRLCQIQAGNVHCHGDDGSMGRGVFGLHEDRRGNLWAGITNGLWRWRPDPRQFYPTPGRTSGIQGFVDTPDGDLLIPATGSVQRFAGGKFEPAYPFPTTVRQVRGKTLIRDREGGLWVGTVGAGIIHIHQGKAEVFRQSDGLSGDSINRLFEDREGSIWVATPAGLDRFRDVAIPTFSVRQGLSNGDVASILGAQDGSVWLSTVDSLNRWNHGQFAVYRERQARGVAGVREIAQTGVPDRGLASLFQDARGRIWVDPTTGTGYLENERFRVVPGLPHERSFSIAEDAHGNLWFAYQNAGLYRFSPASEVQGIPWKTLGHQDWALALAPDRVDGGLWLGFIGGGIAYFKDGQIRAAYGTGAGLGAGRVADLQLDPDGTLWASTDGGLSRLKNGSVATLTGRNGLPCDTVVWTARDEDDSSWLCTPCGLVRVAHSELAAWAADPARKIAVSLFDSSDGVMVRPYGTGGAPQVTRSTDGKLWFATVDGASVIDPRHLASNKLRPPVHIERIVADGETYAADTVPKLPALTRNLEIDYTALSLAAPEKVRFRYKLEGQDPDWREVGNERHAEYSNLRPRRYRFRVIACNNSGVWNETGASLDFSVAPAYYQTGWFLVSCAAVFLGILWGGYRLRLRYLAAQFNLRLEERVNERTRIARDLHDTLLQSFQGVLLKFHSVSYMLGDHPEAKGRLESAIEQARDAITEGRDAVQGLRSANVITEDIARAITTFGESLAAEQGGGNAARFHVYVEGEPRKLAPIVRDEVYRIASEALRNAFRHAGARRIEVDIHYDKRELRLRVRDDGKGIDPEVLSGGRSGHHGLPGMHERARLAGGRLAIWSKPDSGTEIELAVSAAIAYANTSGPSREQLQN